MKNILTQLRSKLMIFLVEKTKVRYLQFFKKSKIGWGLSIDQLGQYPKDTLGKDLADFLIKENFKLIAGVESHDVYHLILGYSTEVEEEAQMQFFLLGNGKRSLYAMGTSMIAFLTMPDQWLAFWRAYHRGRKSLKIHLWDFRCLLKEKTVNLRILTQQKSIQPNSIQSPIILQRYQKSPS